MKRTETRAVLFLFAVLLTVGASLLASCASTRSLVVDDLPPGAVKGWVSFYTGADGDEFLLQISRIEDGNELPPVRSGDAWSGIGDVRLACTPGNHEFLVRSGNYNERFTVNVVADTVRIISFRRQVIGSSSTTSGNYTTSTTTWYVRGSVASSLLPADPKYPDPAPYLAGLSDRDWGTRLVSLRNLGRLDPRLDENSAAKVRELALKDPIIAVQNEAIALLATLGLPKPAPALYFESFEANWGSRWYRTNVESKDLDFDFHPEGYAISSAIKGDHWVVSYLPNNVKKNGDFDASLECEWIEGGQAGAFGLILGKDRSEFHAFCASKNGGSTVLTYRDEKFSIAVPWTQSAATAIASSPLIRILVSKRGSEYRLSVDDVVIGSFVDASAMPLTGIGLFESGAQTVVFHRILITAP